MWFVHKHQVALAYGGPEEGGWWYEEGVPVEAWTPPAFADEEDAYAEARLLNAAELERAEREAEYEYTSVLAARSCHYAYSVEEDAVPRPYPEHRPHYE